MKESVFNRANRDAMTLAESSAGAKITLKWIAGSTGTWDEHRQEYSGGTTTWVYKANIPCLIKTLVAGDVKYGVWGHCEVGDLIVCIDATEQVDDLLGLRVLFQKIEYMVIPNTKIPYSSMSGMIGEGGAFRALHCRLIGNQQGVV